MRCWRSAGQRPAGGASPVEQRRHDAASDSPDSESGALNAGSNQIDLVTPAIPGVDTQIAFTAFDVGGVHARARWFHPGHGRRIRAARRNSTKSAPCPRRRRGWSMRDSPAARRWCRTRLQQQPDGTYTLRFNGAAGEHNGNFPRRSDRTGKSADRHFKTNGQAPCHRHELSGGRAEPIRQRHSTALDAPLERRSPSGVRRRQESVFDYYNYGRYGPTGIQAAAQVAAPAVSVARGPPRRMII